MPEYRLVLILRCQSRVKPSQNFLSDNKAHLTYLKIFQLFYKEFGQINIHISIHQWLFPFSPFFAPKTDVNSSSSVSIKEIKPPST